MKKLISIDANSLAVGILNLLTEMKEAGLDPVYPVSEFEKIIMETKEVSRAEAKKVTEAVISTGVIRWEIFGNKFCI